MPMVILWVMNPEVWGELMEQAYLTSIKNAAATLTLAAAEAEATLPSALTQEHWARAKHGPNAWQEMSEMYPELLSLDALAEITRCLNLLQGVLLRAKAQEQPVDLRLVKMKGTR